MEQLRLRAEALSLAEAGAPAEESQEEDGISSLPTALAHAIFFLLPVDSRLRCREVCKAWRRALEDPEQLWSRCDLSASSVLTAPRSSKLLHAAASRARGGLRKLDVSGPTGDWLDANDLETVAARNGNMVSLLAWGACYDAAMPGWHWLDSQRVDTLLAALPMLRELQVDAATQPANAGRLLAHPLLKMESLYVSCYERETGEDLPLDICQLSASCEAHPTLRGLRLRRAHLNEQPALDAVCTLAINQLARLELTECQLNSSSLPALARLLAVGSLSDLVLEGDGREILMEGPGLPAFCAALRASRLRKLSLRWCCLFNNLEDGQAVLTALAGHETLRVLDLKGNRPNLPLVGWGSYAGGADRSAEAESILFAVGAALASLLTQDSVLESLSVEALYLKEGMRPLFDALPACRRLTSLEASWNDLGEAFVAERVLPAVRANQSLRAFFLYQGDAPPEAELAMREVRHRAAAAVPPEAGLAGTH